MRTIAEIEDALEETTASIAHVAQLAEDRPKMKAIARAWETSFRGRKSSLLEARRKALERMPEPWKGVLGG